MLALIFVFVFASIHSYFGTLRGQAYMELEHADKVLDELNAEIEQYEQRIEELEKDIKSEKRIARKNLVGPFDACSNAV